MHNHKHLARRPAESLNKAEASHGLAQLVRHTHATLSVDRKMRNFHFCGKSLDHGRKWSSSAQYLCSAERSSDSLSAEKSYRHWHADLGVDDTPMEAGIGFTCLPKIKRGDEVAFLGGAAWEPRSPSVGAAVMSVPGASQLYEFFTRTGVPVPLAARYALYELFAGGKSVYLRQAQ